MTTSITFLEDCMNVMARYPDGYFDLVHADPPYFSGPERRGFYGVSGNTKTNANRRDYPKSEAWTVPDHFYFDEVKRVSKHQIIWGVNYYNYQFGPGRIVWDKVNQESSYSDCEIAYCSMHYSVRLFRFMWNGMMQGKSIAEGHIQRGDKSKNQERIHTCEKPVELYQWSFQKYAKPGWKILDTHLGSGSHRLAAYDMGFDFYGCELDPVHFAKQETRFAEYLKKEKAKPALFTGRVKTEQIQLFAQ